MSVDALLPALGAAIAAGRALADPDRLSGTGQSGKRLRSSRRPTARSRAAEWRWELVTDDLLQVLLPAALTAVRQVAEELTVRDRRSSSTGGTSQASRGAAHLQRDPLMLAYLTDVRGERVAIIQVNWIS